MLNVFQSLLTFQLAAPFILRVTIGLIFLKFGYQTLKNRREKAEFVEGLGLKPGSLFVWILGILEIIAGGFLLIGFLTQTAALFAALTSLTAMILKKKHASSTKCSGGFLILIILISISLLFTGAGFLAIDLPL